MVHCRSVTPTEGFRVCGVGILPISVVARLHLCKDVRDGVECRISEDFPAFLV